MRILTPGSSAPCPNAASAAVAKRFDAQHIGLPQTGGYAVARSQARAFANALKAEHLLVYAQANVLRKSLQASPTTRSPARPTTGARTSPTRR